MDAYNQTTAWAYDPNGQVRTITDQLRKVTKKRFDALNRLIERTDAGGGLSRFEYDGAL